MEYLARKIIRRAKRKSPLLRFVLFLLPFILAIIYYLKHKKK